MKLKDFDFRIWDKNYTGCDNKNFWFITCKEIETNLQIDYKVKKNL